MEQLTLPCKSILTQSGAISITFQGDGYKVKVMALEDEEHEGLRGSYSVDDEYEIIIRPK